MKQNISFNKNVDVLLINPFSWVYDRPAYLPYGVLYIASYLRQRNISVAVFDQNTRRDDIVNDIIKLCKPKVVGISVLTGPVIKNAVDISREIKAFDPNISVVWGGLHPTLFPKTVLAENSVDYIIMGEGEAAFYELICAVINGNDVKTIQNLGLKDRNALIINPMRDQLIDLNENSMPAWDLVDIDRYVANRFFASKVITLNTSRGCPFKCAFCFNQGLPHQRWRALNAQNVLRQIEFVKQQYGINGIQFYEDSFDTDKKRVREFSELLINKKTGVRWSHFSNIIYYDQPLIKLEMDAGCKYIEYGVESGSDRILKAINKKQTVTEIRSVFEGCRRIGIKTAALFMIGYPMETEKELMETVSLVESLSAHILICTIYRPYPGTPLYDYCVANKKFAAPRKLEEQAEFYRFSHMDNDEINLSDVPTKVLLEFQRSFFAKFALKELSLCVNERNFSLFIYYIKQQIRPKNFIYTAKSLITRFCLMFKSKRSE